MKLRVTSEDCARCEYDRGPVLEGALHAKLTPRLGDRYRWQELWLARLTYLHLELDTEEIDLNQDLESGPTQAGQRFAHNLASIVSFAAGLRYLRKLELTVFCTFQTTLSTSTSVAGAIERLFCALRQKKETDMLDFGIIQVVIVREASVLEPDAPVRIAEGNAIEPLLNLAALSGFKPSEIRINEIQDRRKNFSTSADIRKLLQGDINCPTYEQFCAATSLARKHTKLRPQLLYRIANFDEDFDDLPEDEKNQLKQEEELVASGTFFLRYPTGPAIAEDTGGCVIHKTAKYHGYRSRDTAPLYLEKDF